MDGLREVCPAPADKRGRDRALRWAAHLRRNHSSRCGGERHGVTESALDLSGRWVDDRYGDAWVREGSPTDNVTVSITSGGGTATAANGDATASVYTATITAGDIAGTYMVSAVDNTTGTEIITSASLTEVPAPLTNWSLRSSRAAPRPRTRRSERSQPLPSRISTATSSRAAQHR